MIEASTYAMVSTNLEHVNMLELLQDQNMQSFVASLDGTAAGYPRNVTRS